MASKKVQVEAVEEEVVLETDEAAPETTEAPEPEVTGPTYAELFDARTEMDNAQDEVVYWRRALKAAGSVNTIGVKADRVATAQAELEKASERYADAYLEFHKLRTAS